MIVVCDIPENIVKMFLCMLAAVQAFVAEAQDSRPRINGFGSCHICPDADKLLVDLTDAFKQVCVDRPADFLCDP